MGLQLVLQLTHKAQQAYTMLPADEAKDYGKVKAAILRWYTINDEIYHCQFRSAKLKTGETPWELVTFQQDLAEVGIRLPNAPGPLRFNSQRTVVELRQLDANTGDPKSRGQALIKGGSSQSEARLMFEPSTRSEMRIPRTLGT